MAKLWPLITVGGGVLLALLTTGWTAARPSGSTGASHADGARVSLLERLSRRFALRSYVRSGSGRNQVAAVVNLSEWRRQHPAIVLHYAISNRDLTARAHENSVFRGADAHQGVVAVISQAGFRRSARHRSRALTRFAGRVSANLVSMSIPEPKQTVAGASFAVMRMSASAPKPKAVVAAAKVNAGAAPVRTPTGAAGSAGGQAEAGGASPASAATTGSQNSGSLQKERVGLKIAAEAMSLLGKPYVWGGASPETGFDCSGFVQYVLGTLGMSAPRTSWQQYSFGENVPTSKLQPGDLLFFTTYAGGPSHVGIYVGNEHFVNALNPSTGVTLSSLSDPYFSERFLGARCPWESG